MKLEAPQPSRIWPLAGPLLLALVLAGCSGSKTLDTSLVDYDEAYASSSNRQMLINLARRSQNHPAYFLQLGSINATYVYTSSVTASLGDSGTRTRSRSGAPVPGLDSLSETLTGGLSASVTGTEQPTFSFTPLSGKTFSKAVLNPISTAVFFNLFNQGLHADRLMRALVQSVMFTASDGSVRNLVNIPDEHRPKNYKNFLRLAGLMRELQLQNLLYTITSPSADGKSTITHFAPVAEEAATLYQTNPHFQFLSRADGGVDVPMQDSSIVFDMRTFEGVLGSLATEYQVFDLLATKHPEFLESIPPSERQPILRIDWTGFEGPLTDVVVDAEYRGKQYSIRDPIIDEADTEWVERHTWNRDVFMLLVHLFALNSLDPKELPVQQLIQVQ